jgi:ABC-type multidrug transport system fused ATPase/permease subunit
VPPAPSLHALRARLRETASLTAHARRTLALVASVDRALLVILLVCQLLDAFGAVAVAYVGKRIVDALVAALRAPGAHAAGPALTWVAIEFALIGGRALVGQVGSYAQVVLRSKLGLEVNRIILEKAANVSYGHFEDPEFMNKMTQARREASARPLDLVNQVMALVRHAITLVGYAALLWSLGAWAVLVLVATAIPPFLAEARYGRAMFALQRARTLKNRRTFYLESVLTTEQTVKEIKLFALARWLIDWYRALNLEYQGEEMRLAATRARAAFGLGLLGTLALYGTYGYIVTRTAAGAITLGSMTLYMTVFRQGQSTLQGALGAIAKAYEDNLFMTNLFEYLAVPDDEPDHPLEDRAAAAPPRVEFEHVSYRYPGASRDALTDINLTLEPGQTLALVGRNGAGKTTLVKLLVGLYRPTEGRILIDGEDVATMSAPTLRQKIGVIFQDFARFQFSAGDNVGVGWLPARDDRAAIEQAVGDAGAREVVERLPQGLDTPLGRAFGGDDLSIGQWQRIALARAFMRKSRILILDEPTAALDAEAEHEIFQRFRDLKANRTALLITHRFATVRMADRIVVFEGGRIVEEGSHAALMAADGRYARMFRLQAQGYALDGEGAPSPPPPASGGAD